ncbi:tetratricopeptide repeat protein [Candidatus Desantisbacteria bacterium]|nr:tetratricopeptide repeat protein [Candidatus Desantisbacteria bacterium]
MTEEEKYNRVSPDLSEEEFLLFQRYISDNAGLFLDDSKLDTLRTALLARTTALNLKDYREYYRFISFNPRGGEEFKELMNLLTVGETYFFRDIKHFEILGKYILPELIKYKKDRGDNSIRIWSAGCSTGEEPYSVAMFLLENFTIPSLWDIEILATDVSTKALQKAREGIYTKWSLRAIDRKYSQKHFTTVENRYHLNDDIKKMVRFEYFNLIREPYPLTKMGNYWDIILCKNVTIYFKIDSTKRVIHDFYQSLRDGGSLFIGMSESLFQISDEFNLVEHDNCFLYKKLAGQEKPTSYKREIKIPVVKKIVYEDAEVNFKQAKDHFKAKHYDRAIVELGKVVRLKPQHTDARLMLADIYANEERYTEAEEECRKVIEINSLLPISHCLLGIVLGKQKRVTEAIPELKKAIYLDQDMAIAHLHLANLYYENKEYNHSAREFKNVLRIMEKDLDTEVGLSDGGFSQEVLLQAKKGIAKLSMSQ